MLVYQRVCTPNKIHMSHVLYPGTKLGNAEMLTPGLRHCFRFVYAHTGFAYADILSYAGLRSSDFCATPLKAALPS